VVEGEPDQVGGEDADRHRELEEADQAAAALRRRDLGDVDGGGGRGEPDRGADHDAGDHQQLDPLRGGAGEGAGDEHDGGDQDRHPPPIAVGGRPGDGGAGDGADRDRGDDQPLGEAAEAEVALDEEQGAGDDTGVVAEQQPTEPGDRRGQHDIALGPPARGLEPLVHPAANVQRRSDRPPTGDFAGVCGIVAGRPLDVAGRPG
jgi:hypothetical protein